MKQSLMLLVWVALAILIVAVTWQAVQASTLASSAPSQIHALQAGALAQRAAAIPQGIGGCGV